MHVEASSYVENPFMEGSNSLMEKGSSLSMYRITIPGIRPLQNRAALLELESHL